MTLGIRPTVVKLHAGVKISQSRQVTVSVLPRCERGYRHAHAGHALDRRAPIHLVHATLGHASAATTGRYLHARPTGWSSRYLAI